jgi:probable F420-dependent oxidoreductase
VTALRLGFGLPVSGSWATGPNMAEIARRAEDLGYDSLWTFQRLLHPAEGDWGAMYRSVQDPLVALAYVAGVTQRVRLGVAIVNAPYVAPVVLAKALTTLDHVSAGRLDAGLGLGWSREEFAAVGVPYERRGARMDEFLRLLQAVWTEDVVSFEGEFYRLAPSRVDPKPVQRPRPPLLLGGSAEPALRRAGRLADGWISASRHDLTSVGAAIDVVRSAAADAGRDVDALRFVVRGVVLLEDDARDEDGRRPLHGDAEQIRADLAALERAGITEVFLDLNFHPRVGTPDADPAESMEHAHQVLETFAR